MNVGQLRPGDILLLRSPGRLRWAVRLFDGSEVDRAALYAGDGVAIDIGGRRPLKELLDSAESAIARRLKDSANMDVVLERAAELRDAPAAAQPEVLLALLCCSRKLRAAPSLREQQ